MKRLGGITAVHELVTQLQEQDINALAGYAQERVEWLLVEVMDVVRGSLGMVEGFDYRLGRADGMQLVAEVIGFVRRAIAEIGAGLFGFLADTQALRQAQLARFERHTIAEVSDFGGVRQVIEQALAEALDVGRKLPASPVEHGTVD